MGRAPCCEKNGLKKGPWTPEEDQKLIDFIKEHGYGNWRTLPKNVGLQRCGKSCRLRWTNYLRPDIKRGKFSFEEEETIIQLHSILGNKWSAIAARLPGRTDNEIKNYWNTHIRKKLLRMGIDPVTHSPRLDLLDLNTILNSSLYANYPQVNLSSLLGLQSFVSPELIRLASSLFSSQRQINQGYSHMQTNNLNLVQNQAISHNSQAVQTPVHNTTINPTTARLDTPACNIPVIKYDDYVLDFQGNTAGFGLQNCYGSEFVPGTNYDYYGPSGQTVVDPDPSSDQASTFQGSNSFSVLSSTCSHSSGSALLNSNHGEDIERESYCSNLLEFDIPDVLDVKDFL